MAGVDPRELVPKCDQCGTRIRPNQPGVWYEVIGWVENRGATGGSNAVAFKRPTKRYRCPACMTVARRAPEMDQPTLL